MQKRDDPGLEELRTALREAAVARMRELEAKLAAKGIHVQCGVELDVFFKKKGWSVTTIEKSHVNASLAALPSFEAFIRQADKLDKVSKAAHFVPMLELFEKGAGSLPVVAITYPPIYMGLKKMMRAVVSHYQVLFNNTSKGQVKPLERLAADIEASRGKLADAAVALDAGKAEFDGGRYKEKLFLFSAPSMHINSSVWEKDSNMLCDAKVFSACTDASLIMQREAPLLKLSTPQSYGNMAKEQFYTKSVDANLKGKGVNGKADKSLLVRGKGASLRLEDRLSMADCDAYLAVTSSLAGMYAGLVQAGKVEDAPVKASMAEAVELLHHEVPNRLQEKALPRDMAEARGRFAQAGLSKEVLGERLYHAAGRYYDAVLAVQGESVAKA